MSTFWLFAVLGAATGALYTLGSLGLVLTYRGSGTVNFASGAIGMVGAFVYWELTQVHVSVGMAVIAGVLVSGALGYFTYLMMRGLRSASQLSKVVLTIVILVTIEGVAELKYPSSNSYVVRPQFPTGSVAFFSIHVGRDRLLLLAAAAIITVLVFAVYRYTRFGLATSAVAENPDSASVVGWSADRIAAANWVLGSALAGLGAVLLVPILGLSDGLAIELLLPSLAAAVIGNLTSFPLTLLGGLAIGIAQSELQNYVHVQGIVDIVPFAVIIVIITWRGRRLPLRSHVGEKLPKVTSGQVNWKALIVAAVLASVLIEWALPLQWISATTASIAAVLSVISLVVIIGFAGQISLAQWAIAGMGAFIMARLVMTGMGFELAILLTLVASVPMGVVIGLASFRARGMSLAIATLALGVALVGVVLSNPSLNGQDAGLTIGSFHLFGINLDSSSYPRRFAIFELLVLVAVSILVINVRRSGIGRRLLAVRANERAAASLGISVESSKVAAFCYSSFLATIAGIVVAVEFSTVVFSVFDSFTSVQLVSEGVLGGIGYTSGALLGSQGQPGTIVSRGVENIGGSQAFQWLTVILGVLTILTLVKAPDGLVPMNVEAAKEFWRRVRGRARPPGRVIPVLVPSSQTTQVAHPAVELTVTGLTVRLGGVRALDGADLTLRSGEIVGLIGPNGAGKTTLIDAISGFVHATSGTVALDGRRLNSRSPRQRATLGIARSFQSLELFEDLTVYENLVVACDRWISRRWILDVFRPGQPEVTETAVSAAQQFDLWDPELLAKYPGQLSHGSRRLVAMARSVATSPRVLLLDEPAAGLDQRERTELAEIVRWLARDKGLAVLLVEHDLDLVCDVSDELVALDHGRVICAGEPAMVRSDPRVVESYLGVVEPEWEPSTTAAGSGADRSGQ